MIEITVVEVGEQHVAGTRVRGEYLNIPVMIKEVCEFVFSRGLQMTGPPAYLCHEMSVEQVMEAEKNGNADLEVVVPVSGTTDPTDTITFYDLPGGKMVKTIHEGPYEECQATYDELFAWLAEKKMEITGPIREIYMNDPREVTPEEIITEIYVPTD